MTPGDDYRRFIPLIDATPWWLHALWMAASVLFVASAWQLLRDRDAAFPLFGMALTAGTIGNAIARALPAYREAFSFSSPLLMRDCVIPIASVVVPLVVVSALWAHAHWTIVEEPPDDLPQAGSCG
jgi:Na+/glutamate symporter